MSNELAKQNEYLQMMPIAQAQSWYNEFVDFSKSILKPDLDFGIIPGTPKPTLYKAGAEKMRFVYGYGVEFECIEKTVDLDRPFIDYSYRCTIVSKAGQRIAQCEGSCNSLEPKFGYLWKTINDLPTGFDVTGLPVKTSGKNLSEFEFAINKSETTGQYGKPAEYWQKFKDAINNGTAKKIDRQTKGGKTMVAYELNEAQTVYRVLNPDVIGVKNTIMKMAQKRAFVGATLLATGASEFFTQDLEDMDPDWSQKSMPKDSEIIGEFIRHEVVNATALEADIETATKLLKDTVDFATLQAAWINIPAELKPLVEKVKDELKAQFKPVAATT